jgi:hypothetical protein
MPFAFAFSDFDSLSGVDRRFTTENFQEVFAETFHKNEILSESPIVDEVKLQPLDSWRYYRSFASGVNYDTNASATVRDPKPEVVYSYSPVVGMSHRTQYTYLKMFYNLSYADYVHNDKSSRFNNSHTTDLRYNFNHLKVNITNSFKPDSSFVQGERTDLKTTDGKNVLTYANGTNINVEYKHSSKTSLTYSYENSLFYFPKTDNVDADNSLQSSMTHTFSPKLTYRIKPKTSIFLEHKYGILDFYKGGLGTHENVVNAGVSGKIFSNIGISVAAGYNYLEFMKSNAPAIGGFNYSVGVSKKILPKVRATLSTTRMTNREYDTILYETNKFVKNFYGMNLSWRVSPKVNVDAEASAGYTDREGFITRADLDNPTNRYRRPREDQLYKLGLRLTWDPRPYFSLMLGYEYVNANSSFKDFEYYSHKFATSFSYKF